MGGPTHRRYAVFFAYITVMLLFKFGISNINYYLCIPIIVMAAKVGAQFPDVDHEWSNVANKTVINKILNTLIHITGGKHRSWQTHSIDICILCAVVAYIIPTRLFNKGLITEVNKEVMLIICIGFMSGWISHMFSDMLTMQGVRLVCWNKFKVRIVPKKIGKFRFSTGGDWEKFNFKVMKYLDIIAGAVCIIYPMMVNGSLYDIISTVLKY